jgi:hypothetical protein
VKVHHRYDRRKILPPVLLVLLILVPLFATGFVYTDSKFAAGIIDTGGK